MSRYTVSCFEVKVEKIMTLPSSGKITLKNIKDELNIADGVPVSLNSQLVRSLAGKPTGKISLSDLHGKSAAEELLWSGTYYSTYGSKIQTGGSVVGIPWPQLNGNPALANHVRLPNCVVERIETSHPFVGIAKPGESFTTYNHNAAVTYTNPPNESSIYNRLSNSGAGGNIHATVRVYGRRT